MYDYLLSRSSSQSLQRFESLEILSVSFCDGLYKGKSPVEGEPKRFGTAKLKRFVLFFFFGTTHNVA